MFSVPPCKIQADRGVINKDRTPLFDALTGFSKDDGMDSFFQTQLPLQDQHVRFNGVTDMQALPSQFHLGKFDPERQIHVINPFILVRFQRNPSIFFYQAVCLPPPFKAT